MDISDVLGKATLPERSVSLCLAGDLQGRFEELEHTLRDASTVALSLGQSAPATLIAREMDALRQEMLAAEVTFRLRALAPKPWRDLWALVPQEAKTDEEKATYDERYHSWVCSVVAATCYDPAMTPAQADELAQVLSSGQWKLLSDTCWEVNAGRRDIPFSHIASALIHSSESSSKLPELGASPTAASSAKSRSGSRRTSTTKRAA